MRFALFGLALVVAACTQPIRSDLPDSAFQADAQMERECFDTIADALAPLVERLKAPDRRGERGVSEVRVARRDQRIFVVDALTWDSDHDRSYFSHERHLFQRESMAGAQWCRIRVLSRPSHSP